MNDAGEVLVTLRDWLRYAVSRFTEAQLFFGHGCDNAVDEAAWLILHSLHLPRDQLDLFLEARLTQLERRALRDIIDQRVSQRLPAAYLTHEAWLGGLRFYVDQRVIVPRSYFGEALEASLAPWIGDAEEVVSALDLCTGSGCLAILMAHAYPNAAIDAVDLSADALAVAERNVADHGLQDRIRLLPSDLFEALAGRRYQLIVCNPPYVTGPAMRSLPPEFRHEPTLALAAGEDGLDLVRTILGRARQHLEPQGVLAVEIGHNRDLVEQAFPRLPFTWIATASDEGKIFVLTREQLAD